MVSNPTLYRSIGLEIESGEEGTHSFNLGRFGAMAILLFTSTVRHYSVILLSC